MHTTAHTLRDGAHRAHRAGGTLADTTAERLKHPRAPPSPPVCGSKAEVRVSKQIFQTLIGALEGKQTSAGRPHTHRIEGT